MNIKITPRQMPNTQKIYYSFEWGKRPGQRKASGIFTYATPKTAIERDHNKESLRILEVKRLHLLLDWQAIGTGLIPMHRLQANFLDFYAEYVEQNKRFDYRHLPASFGQFKRFLNSSFLSPQDLTSDLCFRFRQFLLDRYNGHTPNNYFVRFKRTIKAATQLGYFRTDPCADISARIKNNHLRKENLEAEEYLRLLKTPCNDSEVRDAFIFCCYTGLRWCDIKAFSPSHVKTIHFIVQKKTQVEHCIALHPVAVHILENRMARRGCDEAPRPLFILPSSESARQTLATWCQAAGINKHITWSCARLSFSILLQDALVDQATVSLLLGHSSTKHVFETYRRYRPKDQAATISLLPNPDPPLPSPIGTNNHCSTIPPYFSSAAGPSVKNQFCKLPNGRKWLWRVLMLPRRLNKFLRGIIQNQQYPFHK